MTEDNSSQKKKVKPKISGWAFACLGIGILGLFVFLGGWARVSSSSLSYESFPLTVLLSVFAIVSFISFRVHLNEKPEKVRGRKLAAVGLWLALGPCLLVASWKTYHWLFPKPGERTYQCRNNLREITAATLVYADEHVMNGNKQILRKQDWKILMEQGDLPSRVFICPHQDRPSEPSKQWQHRISEITCYVELQTFPVSATAAKVPVYACTQHLLGRSKGFFPIAWSDGSTTFFRGTLAEFQAQYLKK